MPLALFYLRSLLLRKSSKLNSSEVVTRHVFLTKLIVLLHLGHYAFLMEIVSAFEHNEGLEKTI